MALPLAFAVHSAPAQKRPNPSSGAESDMNDDQLPEAVPAAVIAEALDKNKEATEKVKKVADDLLVVHAVLQEELAQDTVPEVVDRAVEQASTLEKRLTKSAKLLDEVNASLERAVSANEDPSGAQEK